VSDKDRLDRTVHCDRCDEEVLCHELPWGWDIEFVKVRVVVPAQGRKSERIEFKRETKFYCPECSGALLRLEKLNERG
jgi:hypothetical protein